MKEIVIFGTGTMSRFLAHAITHDTDKTIAAFTVDSQFITSDNFDNLPLVAFESLSEQFSPESHEMLIPLGYRDINGFRMRTCERAKAAGFTLTNYVSSRASIWPETAVNENVIIYEGAIIQAFVQIGRNVTIRAGVNIGHDSIVDDHVFVASGVVTGGKVHIGERCCVNTTVL